MHFRIGNESDIPVMSVIRLGVRENQLSNPDWLTRQMWLDGLEVSGNANTWVCEVDQQVIGFSVARIKENDIWALFVDPEHEANGVGKRLLRLATDWLFARGVAEIHLSTSVGSRADAFYRKQGWQRDEMNAKDEVVYRLRKMGGMESAQ